MDRETRQTNLKKLRLSGIKHSEESNKLRKTLLDNSSVSKLFSAPIINKVKCPMQGEDIRNETGDKLCIAEPYDLHKRGTYREDNPRNFVDTKRTKRNSLTNFVQKGGRKLEKPQEASETCHKVVSEIPPKKVKKTGKRRCSKNSCKPPKSRTTNRQLDIKTSLLRSEQIFSDITSQHCREDNFSADEIILALALSKSQVETNGKICLDSSEGVVVQHVKNKDQYTWRNLPNILRQYGFRNTSADNNGLTSVFVTSANQRNKTKWVGKLTALTLRDCKLQTNKVRCKIESLMALQLNFKAVDRFESHLPTYKLISGELQKLKPARALISRFDSKEKANVEKFYVKSLFEVAHIQAGCLLKDWHAIPGRSRSPRGDSKIKNFERKMNIHMKLEEHLRLKSSLKPKENQHKTVENKNKPSVKDEECVLGLKPLLKTTPLGSIQINNGDYSAILNPNITESYIREVKFDEDDNGGLTSSKFSTGLILSSNECCIRKSNFDVCAIKLQSCYTSQSVLENNHATSIRTRTMSPDIFASSDEWEDTNTIMTICNHEVSPDVPTSYNTNLPENAEIPNATILQVIDLIQKENQPNITTNMQSNVSEDNGVTRNKAFSNNFDVIERSNSNLIKVNKGQYVRRAHSLTEINFLRSQSSTNRGNIEKCVNESGISCKSLTIPSDDTTLKNGKRKMNSSKLNCKKFSSLPCILKHMHNFISTCKEDNLLDVIQNEESEAWEDCMILSDDEINYSIWIADMSRERGEFISAYKKSESRSEKKETDFSVFGLMNGDIFMNSNTITEIASNKIRLGCDTLTVPNNAPCSDILSEKPNSSSSFYQLVTLDDRSNDRLEFGILDNISDPFTEELKIENRTPPNQAEINDNLTPIQNAPVGLDELLTVDIGFNRCTAKISHRKLYTHSPVLNISHCLPDQYEIAGRKYTIRISTGQKPSFMHQTEAEILKLLYGFGIKPIKRKHAIKMLEYIYNSTHPLMLVESSDLKLHSKAENTSKAVIYGEFERRIGEASSQIVLTPNILQLNSCPDTNIFQFPKDLHTDFEDEEYVFQTNVTKKTPRPLLPLHIAWYNLVSSSSILHEKILMYEPIELHEIYVSFKQLGWRFEPKDVKVFLDRRSIIFRYDLAQPFRQSEHHIRKHKTKAKIKIKYKRIR